jgi:hemoglobin/transferrin/lactoferrin receptor protein
MSCIRRGALLRATTALALTAGTAAQAQEGDFLGTITLGQSKRAVQTQTATPLTVIDLREIRDRQAGTIAELIDSVPGVALVNGSTPSGSGINIRGFGANGTFGTDQKVKILVDGATVGAEEVYRVGTQLFTDPSLYRQVEVIRGTVGSFEYGTGIIGGVVRLETKDAADFTGGEPGLAFDQTLDFWSNGNGFASSSILAWQPTERLEFLLNYSYREQDTQEDGAGNEIGNSAYELPSWLAKARLTFGDDDAHSLSFSYLETTSAERDVPYDTFVLTGDVFGKVDRDIVSQTASLSYGYNPLGDDLVDVEVTLSYANQEIDQEYVPGSSTCAGGPPFPCGFPFPPGGFPVVNADLQFKTTKLTAKNTALFATGAVNHELRAGLELIRRERLDAASAPGGTDDRVALFAVNEMEIGPNLTVTPALRYETSSIDAELDDGSDVSYDNDALVGGISARYAFDGGFSVFASAAYTENLPILDDLESPELMELSEKARTWEAGVAYDALDVFAAGDTLAVKATAYDTFVRDVTSYSAFMGVRVDEIDLQGLELEASYAMASGFYVDFNANLVSGEERLSDGSSGEWRNAPADTARMTLGRRFGEALDLSWEVAAARGETFEDERTPGYAVHNLRATWAPQEGWLEGAELRLGIENAGDREYTPYLATRPAPGRNVKLTLSKTF